MRSGQRRAIHQLIAESWLREVRERWDSAPHSRWKPGSQRGGHSWSRATSQLAAQTRSVNWRQRSRLTCTWVAFRCVWRVHSAQRV
jgi:hypothetical protein